MGLYFKDQSDQVKAGPSHYNSQGSNVGESNETTLPSLNFLWNFEKKLVQ